MGPSRSYNLLGFQGNRETTLQYQSVLSRHSGNMGTRGGTPPEAQLQEQPPVCRTTRTTRQVRGPGRWATPNPGPFLPSLILATGAITHLGTHADHPKISPASPTSQSLPLLPLRPSLPLPHLTAPPQPMVP